MAEVAYRAALARVRKAMTCLRLEVHDSIVDDVDAAVMSALLAAYNFGFIEGVKTSHEFETAVEADLRRHE